MSLSEKNVSENIEELVAILSEIHDPKMICGFLTELFTKAEIKDIAARWAIVKELDKKTPQRKIAKELGISLCKITRGSKELKKDNSILRKMLRHCKNESTSV
ncbi:MAG: hypothetical protein Ta2G_03590 [Termitinemataceae bacterium]|nr:hypothetical protein FACS1894102_1390 [Spirochaetia bacterium]GMO48006.1 MAG: hypothetical protein Ta2G_03590 [Termitinemataceae bacterium]